MTEPKVEFDLNSMKTENIELMKILDDLRRWHEYREDRNTPAMQTFEGELSGVSEVRLYVPGKIYGYSGMSTTTGDYWVPMTYSAGVQFNVCFFGLETDNDEGNFVKVRLSSTSANDSKKYRVTLFYLGATDGN